MNTYKYHYQVGFPTNLRKPSGCVELVYTDHARRAARNDRYGRIEALPRKLRLSRVQLIEAEALADGTLVKGLYRMGYDDNYWLLLAIAFCEDGAVVKTVWKNQRADQHATLQRELYSVPTR
jgi:hypothetical protein